MSLQKTFFSIMIQVIQQLNFDHTPPWTCRYPIDFIIISLKCIRKLRQPLNHKTSLAMRKSIDESIDLHNMENTIKGHMHPSSFTSSLSISNLTLYVKKRVNLTIRSSFQKNQTPYYKLTLLSRKDVEN